MRKMLGGNVLGFRGNPLGITAMLRKSAATGGDFTATGQEFSARAQQFMAEPWELPAMFGESVAAGWDLTATLRDSAAAPGTARQWLGNARKPSGLPGETREIRRVVPGIYGHTAAGAFGTGEMGAGVAGSTGTWFGKLGLACRVKSFPRMRPSYSRIQP